MTNKILEIPDYTDDQIEDIIKKVEEAKPWSGGFRSIEMFLLSLYSNTIFTFLGLNLSLFLGFSYYDLITPYSISVFINSTQIMFCMPLIAMFSLIDVYFYFNPSKIDKMSIRDWCEIILGRKNECIKNMNIFNLIFLFLFTLIIIFYNDLSKTYMILFIFCTFMSFLYKNTNSISSIFISKSLYDNIEKVILVENLLRMRIILFGTGFEKIVLYYTASILLLLLWCALISTKNISILYVEIFGILWTYILILPIKIIHKIYYIHEECNLYINRLN